MNWKTIFFVAAGSTLGVVSAQFYFHGFDVMVLLGSGIASILGAIFMGYVSTLGKRNR